MKTKMLSEEFVGKVTGRDIDLMRVLLGKLYNHNPAESL